MSAAIQGARPHSKPPLRTMLCVGGGGQVRVVAVGVVGVVVVLVVMVERMGGRQEQAEL